MTVTPPVELVGVVLFCPLTSLVIEAGMVGVSVISGLDFVKSMAVSTEDLRLKSSALGTLSLIGGRALPLSCKFSNNAANSRLTSSLTSVFLLLTSDMAAKFFSFSKA